MNKYAQRQVTNRIRVHAAHKAPASLKVTGEDLARAHTHHTVARWIWGLVILAIVVAAL